MNDIVLLLFRLLVGAFFVLYRFRWVWDPALKRGGFQKRYVWDSLYREKVEYHSPLSRWFNRERHARLEAKLMECGYAPQLAVPVAVVELLAGLALIAGVWVQLSALGLLIILVAATVKTARVKVAAQKPVDAVDWASCYLWLPEPLYIAMCFALLVAGGGNYALPWFI